MTQNDLTKKFSRSTRVTHGITALLILALFPMGKYMEGLEISEKMGLVKIHAILGIIVLVLTIIRTISFFKHERPTDLKTGSKFNDKLAVWIHNIFYFLLFGIAISGLAAMILGGYGEALKTGVIDIIKPHSEIPPMKAHGIMATVMIILLVMHVAGFIKHLVLKKENTLKRIL
ncbi:cytochrome b/b6 domain-containing protein [Ancylomarina sp. DW003]|nr:cytochrome b/b6 domain-containing protein [Ancylomarina sp. DW003]MDE5423072.1 cytochrome b/b6 domain-containing protein [Ancylomarina sp. DW003]